MKIFSMLRERRPLTHTEAWGCALVNQLATPGLGTFFARRFVAGTMQLLLAVTGFFLIMGWMIQKFRALYGQMFGTTLTQDAGNQLGKWGVIFFAVAWAWSFFSSVQIVMNAPKSSPPPPKIR